MTGKKRIIYLLAVVGAVVILLADRLVVGRAGPAIAEGVELARPSSSVGGPRPARPLVRAQEDLAAVPFPVVPAAETPAPILRNPFILPPDAGGPGSVEIHNPTTGNTDQTQATVASFVRGHVLKGVLLTGDGQGTALIDDVAIDIGQVFDGAQLLRVTSAAAHFRCADGVAILEVAP